MWFRVRALESQIHEFELETEGLSHSLEDQKKRTLEVEAAGQKRADELLKEVQKKVRPDSTSQAAKTEFITSLQKLNNCGASWSDSMITRK
jgi:hypothetical protein